MRHFYKTLEGIPVAPLMVAVMDRQNLFAKGPEASIKADGVLLRNGTGDKDAMAVFGANGREEVLQFQVVRDHVDPLVSQSFID